MDLPIRTAAEIMLTAEEKRAVAAEMCAKDLAATVST
jgi:hypothetical protein